MTALSLNRRQKILLRCAPLALALSLVWLIVAFWRGPISFWYILWWVGVGLSFSVCGLLGWIKPESWWSFCSVAILSLCGIVFANALFPNEQGAGWIRASRGCSIVLVIFSALAWALRGKIISSTPGDVEQIVGPERSKVALRSRGLDDIPG